MPGYKLVCREYTSRRLVSAVVLGDAQVVYEVDKWARAPEYLVRLGYSLTYFPEKSYAMGYKHGFNYASLAFELWYCFDDGNPVKPTLDPSGALLIPLKRSRDASSSIFMKLELIFFSDDSKMLEEGMLHFRLPAVDLQIMKMGWELLLPLNYEYEDWTGNLRQTGRGEFLEYVTPLSSGRAGQKVGDVYPHGTASAGAGAASVDGDGRGDEPESVESETSE